MKWSVSSSFLMKWCLLPRLLCSLDVSSVNSSTQIDFLWALVGFLLWINIFGPKFVVLNQELGLFWSVILLHWRFFFFFVICQCNSTTILFFFFFLSWVCYGGLGLQDFFLWKFLAENFDYVIQLFRNRNTVSAPIMMVFFIWLQQYQFCSATYGGFGFGLFFKSRVRESAEILSFFDHVWKINFILCVTSERSFKYEKNKSANKQSATLTFKAWSGSWRCWSLMVPI